MRKIKTVDNTKSSGKVSPSTLQDVAKRSKDMGVGQAKISQFADCIHSSIAFSQLEKRVISTTLFNRLHNVLQNSSLYLTYPCNRTSRFSHSLGCMHLAGEMFKHSILNADEGSVDAFFSAVRTEVDAFNKDPRFSTQRKRILADASENVDPFDLGIPTDHLYAIATPVSLKSESRTLYIQCYQAIRLVGLLHDIGHPPFSHVTEDAIGLIVSAVSGSRAPAAKNFVRTIAPVPGKVFHEDVGAILTQGLLEGIVRTLTDTINEAKPDKKELARRIAYQALLVSQMVGKILASEGALFQGLHAIVDGPIDADRLDYVVRDLFASGIYRDTIQYSRLLSSYKLYLHPTGKSFVPHFLPSTRALSTIEDFLWQRLFLYRYVIFHHRVVKMDGLLREALVELARSQLLGTTPSEAPEPDKPLHLLPVRISSLWSPLLIDKGYDQRVSDIFSQWDDALLLSLLRQHYFAENGVPTPLKWQLDEILSNQKHYTSVIKRIDHFLEIDIAFTSAAKTDPNGLAVMRLRELPGGKRPPAAAVTALGALANELKSDIMSQERCNSGRGGIFLSKLCSLLKTAGYDEKKFLYSATAKLQESLKRPNGDTHLFVVRKELKAGISDNEYLASDSGRVRLTQISPIVDELRRTVTQFPPFFLFGHFGKGIYPEFSRLRATFGTMLFQAYKDTYLRKERRK